MPELKMGWDTAGVRQDCPLAYSGQQQQQPHSSCILLTHTRTLFVLLLPGNSFHLGFSSSSCLLLESSKIFPHKSAEFSQNVWTKPEHESRLWYRELTHSLYLSRFIFLTAWNLVFGVQTWRWLTQVLHDQKLRRRSETSSHFSLGETFQENIYLKADAEMFDLHVGRMRPTTDSHTARWWKTGNSVLSPQLSISNTDLWSGISPLRRADVTSEYKKSNVYDQRMIHLPGETEGQELCCRISLSSFEK